MDVTLEGTDTSVERLIAEIDTISDVEELRRRQRCGCPSGS